MKTWSKCKIFKLQLLKQVIYTRDEFQNLLISYKNKSPCQNCGNWFLQRRNNLPHCQLEMLQFKGRIIVYYNWTYHFPIHKSVFSYKNVFPVSCIKEKQIGFTQFTELSNCGYVVHSLIYIFSSLHTKSTKNYHYLPIYMQLKHKCDTATKAATDCRD